MKKTLNIPKTFIGFLIASLFFWVLINLSKTYTSEVNYDIEYINLPQHKTLINTPLKNINLLVKASGFNLLTTNISNKPIKLDLEKTTKKKGINYYFLSKNIQPQIQNQLKSGVELIQILKDSISLKIGTLSSKKVPLKPNLNINFKLGFDLAKSISIKPDSILISGDESELKNIAFLDLEKLDLKNVSENIEVESNIITPKNSNFKISSKQANIIITVDKFTEGEIEVPVIVKNAPDEINIFPKKVKLIYKVGLSNFNKINPDLFKIECDYNEVNTKGVSYLTPKAQSLSDLVTLIRIVPDKIDFLIHE